MKSVSEGFIAARLRTIPPPIIKTVILSEMQLDGTLLNNYDLSAYLKGKLPIITKEVELEMNNFVTGEITLKFLDSDKTIDNIVGKSNRKFGLKVSLALDMDSFPLIDNITEDGIDQHDVCKIGNYAFTGHTNGGIKAYSFLSNEFALIDSIEMTGWSRAIDTDGTNIYSGSYYDSGQGGFRVHSFIDETLALIDELTTGNYKYCWDLVCGTGNLSGYTFGVFGNYGLMAFNLVGSALNHIDTDVQSGSAQRIDTDGTYIYVGHKNQGVRAYSFSDPTITYIAQTSELGYPNSLRCKGGYIFVGYSDGTIRIYTFNGSNFTLVASFASSASSISGLAIDDGTFGDKIYIFAGGHYSGLYIFVFDKIDIITYVTEISVATQRLILKDNQLFTANRSNGLSAYGLYEENLTLFDGMVDVEQTRRFGRNTLSLTAQTWEKEFEHHNAELVFDKENMPCSNITGVAITSVFGGQPGLKILEYKFLQDDAGNLIELRYENGNPVLLEIDGNNYVLNLKNEGGDQILQVVVYTSEILKENAEDSFIIGQEAISGPTEYIGDWYQCMDLQTLVQVLFDRTIIPITDETIDINEEIMTLTKENFVYFKKFAADESFPTWGNSARARISNKSLIDDGIFTFAQDVYSYVFDEENLTFTKTHKFDITSYLPGALYVEQVFSDADNNKYLICVDAIKSFSDNEDWSSREYVCCAGIIKVDLNGDYVTHWTKSDLRGIQGFNQDWILAKSFHMVYYTKLGYSAFGTYSDHITSIYAMVFDFSSGSIVGAEHRTAGDLGFEYGQAIVIAWDNGNTEISQFWVVEFRSDTQTSRLLWDRPQLGTEDWLTIEELDYMTGDMKGQFKWHQTVPEGGKTFWCLYSNPKTASEDPRRQILLTFDATDTTFPTKVWSEVVFDDVKNNRKLSNIPDWYPYNHPFVYGWKLNDDNNKESIIRLSIPTAGELPEVEILHSGFLGEEYKIHTPIHRKRNMWGSGIGWIGVATRGYSNTCIAVSISNKGKNLIPIANFKNMNVREAIDELARLVCYWKRPERQKALFYSRGNYNGTCTLENNLYKSDYVENKTRPYVGVEVKNSLHEQYVYRYPDAFNAEEGEIFKLSNRFIFPLNGYIIAKMLADWLMQIKIEVKVNGFFLIELEELDKIEWKKYHGDGTPDEQVDCVLLKASYDDRTKLVKMRMVKLVGYPYKAVAFEPNSFAES